MFRFAIERGIILSVAISVLMLFGVVAIFQVPVQMTPDIDQRVISVRTIWPGATPQEIESEILVEQEQYLRRVKGLQRMTGEATTGRATIDLEFDASSDIQELLVRVNSALSQVAEYPENVDPPRLITNSSSQQSFIFMGLIPADPDQYSRAELTSIIEKHIITQIERIPGVAELVIFGTSEAQVHVRIDPAALSARGITIAELRNAIRARNTDFSGGDLDSGKRRYIIRTVGRYEDLDQIRNTIIAERNGNFVRIADVASVSLGAQEQRVLSYLNGTAAIMMGVQRSPGSNVIDILHAVENEIDTLNNGRLKNYDLSLIKYSDDVKYVSKAINVVQKNLALGGLLACAVLYLFLRAAAPTALGALGVPLCTVGAFLGLLIMGRTLNVISLAGIAFAIGMTLDNSIVVLENIIRHRAMRKSPARAALDGVSEVWPAVLASTLTTIFVFTPIVLINEEVGQLYSDIAIAISAAIIMSMIVAVSVIPSLAARLPEQWRNGSSRSAEAASSTQDQPGWQQIYLATVDSVLGSRSASAAVVACTLITAVLIIAFLTPKAEYLPEGEESKLFVYALAPPGYNIDEVNKVGNIYDAMLRPQLVSTDRPRANDFDESMPPVINFLRYASSAAMFSITEAGNTSDIEQLKTVITDKLRENPGFIVFANRGSLFSGNTGGSRSIQLDITGARLEDIYAAASEIFGKAMTALPGSQIRPLPGINLGQPAVVLTPNWPRAAELGITSADLGYAIWSLVDGAFLDEYFHNGEKIDIFLYGSPGQIQHPHEIANLPIHTPSGATVTVSSIADLSYGVSSTTIRRIDADRTVTLNVVPPRSVALEKAVEIINSEVVAAFESKSENDVTLAIGGASDKLDRARVALSGNIAIAIALAYLLMVAVFSHWGFPLLILLSIPLGISGGILGLWIVNNLFGISAPLDMITMLGAVVLIGTVVNNPILLVEQTRKQLQTGAKVKDAIRQAVQIRLRPVMMSMTTTTVGLSPVVFLAGAGTELYRGLGSIVMFGLFFSTMITLIFIPALLNLVLAKSVARPEE